MLDLNNRNWASFKISDLFQPARGTEKNMTSLQVGDVPLISARNCDNGVKAFVSIPSERLHHGHAITLNNDGDGGAGLAYYQPMEFALDTHVTELRPRDSIGNLSRYAMQFVAASISKQRTLFGHGRSISLKRLNLLRVMLPIDESGNPDWQFMEDYIREREVIQVERCREFLMKRITVIEERESKTGPRHLPSLSEKTWHKFKAFGPDGLFQIKTTNSSIDAVRLVKGRDQRCPYITRTDSNNGIARFVSSRNKEMGFDLAGTITIGLDTQTAYYQPANYVTGQNIQIVSGENLSEPVALFLLSILRSQMKAKFNWGGNGATLGRLLELQIMLPATDDGLPDYSYMSSYSHNIALHTLKRQLAFLNR